MVRNETGKVCGKTVATTLYKYATPVPMAISVNILVLRFTIDVQPRWKNGQPPHSTTGVANANSIHGSHVERNITLGFKRNHMNVPGQIMLPIAISRSGAVSATPTQKRRVISRSSGFSSSVVLTVCGSSAIPQIGQLPDSARRISGCIGQVNS